MDFLQCIWQINGYFVYPPIESYVDRYPLRMTKP